MAEEKRVDLDQSFRLRQKLYAIVYYNQDGLQQATVVRELPLLADIEVKLVRVGCKFKAVVPVYPPQILAPDEFLQ
jgi:hypothetical protein